VLDQELVAPVLERQHPAAGLDPEQRCAGALIHGGPVLRHREPESLVDRLLLGFLGPV
jgi:hypothetical protein